MTLNTPDNDPPTPEQLAVLKEAARLIDTGVDRPSSLLIADALSMPDREVVEIIETFNGELTYRTRRKHAHSTHVTEITEAGRRTLERFA